MKTSEGKIIVWQNPTPSSTKYCRPIKFIFAKDTTALINKEVSEVKEQIKKLGTSKVVINEVNVEIISVMVLCMIDGKACTALSSYNSSQRCYICGATPDMMNFPQTFEQNEVDPTMLSLGLSILHARIRFMECLLHISYRLEIKKWQVPNELKGKVNERKVYIQNRFKEETGLLIDFPLQNFVNTNDGNTARRFFKDAKKSAEITEIDEDLIIRFGNILECLSSGSPINVDAFSKYAKETADLYLKL